MIEFTDEQLQYVKKVLNEAIETFKNEVLKETKSKIAALESKLNGAYEGLSPETLADIILLNKNLTELQKSQVIAILTATKRDLTYLQ